MLSNERHKRQRKCNLRIHKRGAWSPFLPDTVAICAWEVSPAMVSLLSCLHVGRVCSVPLDNSNWFTPKISVMTAKDESPAVS
jgi:hypothetical protein